MNPGKSRTSGNLLRLKGWRLSLQSKFLLVNIPLLILCGIFAILAFESGSHDDARADLVGKIEALARAQAKLLGSAVWNLDPERTELILTAALTDRDVVRASVYDEGNELLSQVASARFSESEEHLVVGTHPIQHNIDGTVYELGSVVITASDERVLAAARASMVESFVVVMIMTVAACAAALVSYRRTIRRPLGMLLRGILREEGSARRGVRWHSGDEMGHVVAAFNRMQEEQVEYERALENRVEERTEELSIALKEADAANRANADFLATMSLEIRTPLNGVLSTLNLLDETTLDERQQHYVKTARLSAEDLTNIIGDVVDYSRLEAGRLDLKPTIFDPAEVVENVISLMDERSKAKGLKLHSQISKDLPDALLGDTTRLRQILLKLVGNAIRFTKAGEVNVSAAHRELDAGLVELRIEVQDTGIGISREAQSRLFQRKPPADSPTAQHSGGTGLGLAVCKQLVELMGGEIGVQSVPGCGSTFTLALRCQRGEAPADRFDGARTADVVSAG